MYDLLDGIRVLEVALAAPGALGAQLADMGAEVIKVEQPAVGDITRALTGFNHLRWNRGKKGIAVDLTQPQGRDVFLDLAHTADVVVDGLRAGAMEGFGLDYAAVCAVKPEVVYCSLSGMGQTGPYRRLAVHAPALDAFAGIAPVAFREDGHPYMGPYTGVGTQAGALFAAFAVAAALVKAARTGRGQYIDVAELDAAALWRSNEIAQGLNGGWNRPNDWRRADAVRGQLYETSDGKYVVFQPFEEKFWQNFCRAIDRPDLLATSSGRRADLAAGNEGLRAELVAIMKTRTQAEWVAFFVAHDVPGGPVHTLSEMVEDPHFQARGNVARMPDPDRGELLMPTTPIKLPGQTYEVAPAPRLGEHTAEVLSKLLGYDSGRLQALREAKVIS
jgi:crotonobetainyl-CoA:carnitine CoA-transferase CaiB-like acyl-CoA transferase